MNQASSARDAPLRIRIGHYVGVFAKTSTDYSAHVPSLQGLAVTGASLVQAIEALRTGIPAHLEALRTGIPAHLEALRTGIPAHLEALAQDKEERPWLYGK